MASARARRLAGRPTAIAVGLLAGAVVLGGAPAARAAQRTPGPARRVYLVTLAERPAAAYPGGIPGLARTAPATGRRFDRTTPAVAAYDQHLVVGQDRVLARVGRPDLLYRYTTVLDGFAARLDPRQVTRLRQTRGVLRVERSTTHRLDRAGPATALGAASPRTQRLTVPPGAASAGRGTVVGVVDSGIWPENPTFAGVPERAPGLSAGLPGFHGACTAGEGWSAADCNDKVVSARSFVRGFGADAVSAAEYLSPRDASGHGSRAASLAAGGPADGRIAGQQFGRVSGTAPSARIAVYKACWSGPEPDDDGCTTADAVAAVDSAVADGVDVLSYAAAGSRSPRDTLSRAFLNAAAAGVFVATAAGNRGGSGTVEHPAPWVTTVGAVSWRVYRGRVRLGDGTVLDGAMVSTRRVRRTGLVSARTVPAPGVGSRTAALCESGSLDAEKVDGRVVVCERGVVGRIDKSAAVADAGGAGMLLLNRRPGGVDADVHAVPTVHLDLRAARVVRGYLRSAGARAEATLEPLGSSRTPVPRVARFSSRGPSPVDGVLKPDVTAPGVNVLAATAPRGGEGPVWDLGSGTSSSAPQVAGLAATLAAEHPRWSPGEIRSAICTTAARPARGDGPFATGSGHVDPGAADDPGLVLAAGPVDWRRYLAGSLPAQRLNQPSVAVGDLVGRGSVVRRVTNVGRTAETYVARVAGLRGVLTQVRPAQVTVAPGQTRRIRLAFTVEPGARLDAWSRGALTLHSPVHDVRLPVVVRPRAVAAPRTVRGSGVRGSTVVRGRSGPAPVRVRSSGVVPATPVGVTLVPGGFDPKSPTVGADTMATPVTVPAGTEVARFEMDAHGAGDAVHLFLYRDGDLVAQDTGADADATVTLPHPAAGDYTLYVNAHEAGNGATTTGQLYTWMVPETGGTPLDLTPTAAGSGDFRYQASWRHLDPTKRYLGVLTYDGSADRTLVEIH